MIVIIFLFFAKQCEAGRGGQRFEDLLLIFLSVRELSVSKSLVLNAKYWFLISNTAYITCFSATCVLLAG